MQSHNVRREQSRGRQMYQMTPQVRNSGSGTWCQQRQARILLRHQALQLTILLRALP